jgi:aminoglycoside phosphotransferase (APT) family kinase protein
MPALEISPEQLERLVAPLGKLASFEHLTGGMFATTFKVTLQDGRTLVVKTAPADTSSLLSYEHNIVATERLIYEMCSDKPALLMPQVVYSDFTREIVAGDALMVTVLEGTPWNVLAEKSRVRWDEPGIERERGAYFARLHTVTGERYGYPGLPDLQASTWRGAFELMLRAILDDSKGWNIDLPCDEIWAAYERNAHHLETVRFPHLVHMDVWQANVFLDAEERISGIIDTERAIFGDPIFDFIGADQMGFAPVDAHQLQGYETEAQAILSSVERHGTLSGLGPVDIDVARTLTELSLPRRLPAAGTLSNQEIRFLLYRLYFCAIMIVEVGPRAYTGDWLIEHLDKLHTNLRLALAALQ